MVKIIQIFFFLKLFVTHLWVIYALILLKSSVYLCILKLYSIIVEYLKIQHPVKRLSPVLNFQRLLPPDKELRYGTQVQIKFKIKTAEFRDYAEHIYS